MTAGRSRSCKADLRVGISGWRYAPWRTKFYPAKLPQSQELHFASRQFNSVELNGSFYSLQRPERYRRWYDETPDDFIFAVKGGRYITHLKKLHEVRAPLANFFASGVLDLKEKLGPILWQFPPFLPFEEQRFAEFFELLPRTTDEAARLARKHDHRIEQFVSPKGHQGPIRHAIEVRHPSFSCEEFITLLRECEIALVVADSAKKFPVLEDVTASFVYVRLHGSSEIYSSGYSDSELDHWTKRVRAWARGKQPRDAKRVSRKPPPSAAARDVYVYFDNDQKVEAPFNARALCQKLGLMCPAVDAGSFQAETRVLSSA